jgi:Cdc6-like AAA superfamily ATPase
MRRRVLATEHKEILDWLTPIDYGPQQSDYFKKRLPGTSQWLLDSAEYQTWLNNSQQTLFCPGIPGAGKTIITAIVIDDLHIRLQSDTIGIAYLYCDFRQQQGVEDLLSNLLKQLAQKQPSIPDGVQDLYNQYKNQPKRPSLDEVSRALHSVSKLYSKVFIIVDALDECQDTDKCRTTLLSEIFKLQERQRANIFSTSRFIPEILERFKEGISLKIRASDKDVRAYLASHIERLPSFVLSNPDLQNEIKATISKDVDGMCV